MSTSKKQSKALRQLQAGAQWLESIPSVESKSSFVPVFVGAIQKKKRRALPMNQVLKISFQGIPRTLIILQSGDRLVDAFQEP